MAINPVGNFDAVGVDHKQIYLSWTAPPFNYSQGFFPAVFYEIDRKTGSGSYAPLMSTGSLYYVDASVVPEATYSYRVKARSSMGDVSTAVEDSATVPAIPAPTNAVAGDGFGLSVDLAWACTNDSTLAFEIHRRIDSGTYPNPPQAVGSTGGYQLSYNDMMGLAADVKYVYKIRTVRNIAGTLYYSAYSNETTPPTIAGLLRTAGFLDPQKRVEQLLDETEGIPPAIVNVLKQVVAAARPETVALDWGLVALPTHYQLISLRWNNLNRVATVELPAIEVDHYRIFRTPPFPGNNYRDVTVPKFDDMLDLDPGAIYTYTVKAFDADGELDNSPEAKATVPAIETPKTVKGGTVGTTIRLTWDWLDYEDADLQWFVKSKEISAVGDGVEYEVTPTHIGDIRWRVDDPGPPLVPPTEFEVYRYELYAKQTISGVLHRSVNGGPADAAYMRAASNLEAAEEDDHLELKWDWYSGNIDGAEWWYRLTEEGRPDTDFEFPVPPVYSAGRWEADIVDLNPGDEYRFRVFLMKEVGGIKYPGAVSNRTPAIEFPIP